MRLIIRLHRLSRVSKKVKRVNGTQLVSALIFLNAFTFNQFPECVEKNDTVITRHIRRCATKLVGLFEDLINTCRGESGYKHAVATGLASDYYATFYEYICTYTANKSPLYDIQSEAVRRSISTLYETYHQVPLACSAFCFCFQCAYRRIYCAVGGEKAQGQAI